MSISAGAITLDLTLNSKIEEQLKKITKGISDKFSGSVDEVSGKIEKSIQKPFESIQKTAEKATKSIAKPFEGAEKAAEKAAKGVKDTFNNTYSDVESAVSKCMSRMEAEQKKFTDSVAKSANINTNTQAEASTPKKSAMASPVPSMDELDKYVGKVSEKAEKLPESFRAATNPVDLLNQKLDVTYAKIGDAQREADELFAKYNQIANAKGADSNEAMAADKAFTAAQDKLIRLQESASRTESKLNQASAKTAQAVNSAAGQASNSVKKASASAGNAVNKFASKTGNTIKRVLGSAFNKIKSIADKTFGMISNKFKGVAKLAVGASKPVERFGNSIKRAAKSVLLMAGLYAVFKGLKEKVSEACNQNEEFKKSLNSVKANLNVAFTPIMKAIMPAINTLMSGLAKLTASFAAFVSGLFGTTYEKSLAATKQAQKVKKEAEKTSKYLNNYDVMNKAQDTSKDSSSDSDNESNNVDYSALDDVKVPDFAKKLRDATKSGDWTSVGKLFAEKVNSVFDRINWKSIQDKVNRRAKAVADGLNGFIHNLNWGKLGDTLGNGINTVFGGMYTFMTNFDWEGLGKGIAKALNHTMATINWSLIGKTVASRFNALINTLYGFVTKFKWKKFGKSIAKSVNAWFSEIDWAKLGKTLSESVKGILDSVIGFLQTVDWQGIGEKLWTFISSIDWSGIASRLFEAIGSAIAAAVSLLWGFIKDAVFSIRDYFKEKIQECGGNIVEGLFKGIVDALKSLGSWIKEHIFDPFIKGFKKVFGINSPSKVMGEMGIYIIQGLYNAISNGISKIKEIFQKVLSKIKDVFSGIGTWFKNKFNKAYEGIKNAFNGIGNWFSNRWTDIKNVFSGIGTWFKDKFSTAWDGIKGIWSKVATWFSDHVTTPIKKAFSTMWNGIKGILNPMLGGIESFINFFIKGINLLIKGLNKVSINIPDWVPVIGGKKFGFNLKTLGEVELPRLAQGGLATAPTLAMVGDNKNAKTDPEVIAPLSKLQGMLDNGSDREIVNLLKEILAFLKSINFEFIGKFDLDVLYKCIVKLNQSNTNRTGVNALA